MTLVLDENGFEAELVEKIKERTTDFLMKCKQGEADYSLTPISDTSPFSLCFALFLANSSGRLNGLESEFPLFTRRIVEGVYQHAKIREKEQDLRIDKSFLQLLSFSLSALHLLGVLDEHPLDDLVLPLLPENMVDHLTRIKAVDGVPQSGNLAMFMAILSIYAEQFLNRDMGNSISDWVELHIQNMNSFGFWGDEKIKHLQFQNGYHQYEILEYLEINNPKIRNAAEFVRGLKDKRGQFAPYFGGSGCYDYDAVSILTSPELANGFDLQLLEQTASTILSEQNSDGGFSESQWVRPRNFKVLSQGVLHVLNGKRASIIERGRYFLALQSPRHNRMHTHWTSYSRHWGESNLWDTWFRLLTIARIDCALDPKNSRRWGFIDFPGIGYHPSMKEELH